MFNGSMTQLLYTLIMNLIALEVLGVLMRWMHITSAVFTIGGIAYARLIEGPAIQAVPPEDSSVMLELSNARFRSLIYAGIGGLVVSGLYNLLSHPGHTRYYYGWLGVKMLLALHVFAVALWIVKPVSAELQEQVKRAGRLSGTLVSGLFAILIAAYLRRIF